MKKLIFIVFLVAGFVLFMGCKSAPEDNQTKPENTENCKPDENLPEIEIEIKDIEAFKYVCVEEKGNYDKIEQIIGTLWAEAGKQQIRPMGGMFGVYYNDPNSESMDNWKWEMGFKVMGDIKVKAPLVLKEWNYNKIGSYTAIGPCDKTEGMYYPALANEIAKKGYTIVGPAMSIYLTNPNEVKPEDNKTVLSFPIAKVEPTEE
jgi:effector-binding domain-containing protein